MVYSGFDVVAHADRVMYIKGSQIVKLLQYENCLHNSFLETFVKQSGY